MKMLWTLTGMYLPIRLILYPCGMEWVWGICIGVSSVDTHSWIRSPQPQFRMSNGAELTFFYYKPDYEVLRSH